MNGNSVIMLPLIQVELDGGQEMDLAFFMLIHHYMESQILDFGIDSNFGSGLMKQNEFSTLIGFQNDTELHSDLFR